MSLPRTFLTAGWEHVPLLNYTVPRSLLEPLVPRGTEQELWQVECIASLVGFQCLGTRVRGVPLDDRTDEGPFSRPFPCAPRSLMESPLSDSPPRHSSITSPCKTTEVQAAIERVGPRLRLLPPYSPDFNPIEQAFAKLKACPRAARPRTFDQVVELVAIALELFSPAESLNFVRHSGYRVSTVR